MTMRHSKAAIVIITLVLGLSLVACGGSKKSKSKGDGNDFPAEVLGNLKSKGLDHSKFEQVNPAPYGAGICASGQVEGLAILVCQYDDAAKAKAAESKLLAFVQGSVTGLVRTKGPLAIVVADPDKMDLRGKNIAKIVKAFKK